MGEANNITVECIKCNGTGTLPTFRHIEGGVCFRCGGTGRETVKRHETTSGKGEQPLCVGTIDDTKIVCWKFGKSIKVEMESGDDCCVIYCDRDAWRRRAVEITHGSYGYEMDTDRWLDAVDGLRSKLAAA